MYCESFQCFDRTSLAGLVDLTVYFGDWRQAAQDAFQVPSFLCDCGVGVLSEVNALVILA